MRHLQDEYPLGQALSAQRVFFMGGSDIQVKRPASLRGTEIFRIYYLNRFSKKRGASLFGKQGPGNMQLVGTDHRKP